MSIKVTYPGWDKKWDTYFDRDGGEIKDLQEPLAIGQKCQCKYGSTWYDAQIIGFEEGLRYHIHYDGYSNTYDLWTNAKDKKLTRANVSVKKVPKTK